jgi:heparin binding hemagglutinin HbhA
MTTTENKNNKLPAPVYAAAGAGDFAYQKLRKLPAKVAELRERVAANEVDLKVDVVRLRKAARRNAAALATATQAAQERAVALYGELVARGEHVVTGTRSPLKVKATLGTKPSVTTAEPAGETKPVAKKATRPAAPKE